MRQKVEIAIIGRAGVGKTTIGVVITKALEDAGFQVKYDSHDNLPEFFKPEFQERRVNEIRDLIEIDVQEKYIRSASAKG